MKTRISNADKDTPQHLVREGSVIKSYTNPSSGAAPFQTKWTHDFGTSSAAKAFMNNPQAYPPAR